MSRMVSHALATGAILALTSAGPAPSEVLLEARSWSSDPTGRILVAEAEPIDEIDLVADLGIEVDDSFEGRLVYRPTRTTMLRLAWLPLTLSGESVVSRTLTFFGRDFTVSSRVVSELELEYGRAGIAWQFLSTRDGRFRAGPLVEAKGFRGDITLSAPDLPLAVSESATFETAFAAAGLAVDLEPGDRVHLFAEATTLVDTDDGDLVDAEIGVRVFPVESLALVVGYRRFEVDAGDDSERLDLEIEGVFFGLSLHL